MTSLKMSFHNATGRRMVEIYDDNGKFVGCIYPSADGSNAIHIVSNYFDGEPVESKGLVPVPGYLVKFGARK